MNAPSRTEKPFANIQAVSFDVGGTLITPWPSVGHVYAEVALAGGMEQIPARLLNDNFARAWANKRTFDYSRADWSDLVDRTFAGLTKQKPAAGLFDALYRRFAQPDVWRIFEDVTPLLDRLRNRHIPLVVISNWDERLRPLFSQMKLAPYFEALLISSEIGSHKPAPDIFHQAARKLGLPPASILHVGDSRREDLDGARSAGFAAVLIERFKKPPEPDEISSLSQLTDLIS